MSLVAIAVEGMLLVLALPTVKFTYDFTLVPSLATTVSLCAPLASESVVLIFAAFTSYFFTPSTYTCISETVPLEVALAVTCAGEVTVALAAGLAIVITGVAKAKAANANIAIRMRIERTRLRRSDAGNNEFVLPMLAGSCVARSALSVDLAHATQHGLVRMFKA